MFGKSQKFTQFRQSDLSPRINRSWRPGTVSRFLFGDNDDSIEQARKINFSRSSRFEDSGRVSEDDPDYYKFKLRNSGSIQFNFRNRGEESIRFSILDKRDRTISTDGKRLFVNLDGDDKQKLSARLNRGTYFIRIETSDGNNERYSFRLRLNSNRSEK